MPTCSQGDKQLTTLQKALDSWEAQGLTRHLYPIEKADATHIHSAGQDYLNFSSNDYLGLARHPEVIAATHTALDRYGVGSTASHAVCGHFAVHEALEHAFAAWVGLPKACLFSSGYQAN